MFLVVEFLYKFLVHLFLLSNIFLDFFLFSFVYLVIDFLKGKCIYISVSSIYLFSFIFIYPTIYLFIYSSINLLIYLTIYLSIHFSFFFYRIIHLSIYLFQATILIKYSMASCRHLLSYRDIQG